MGIKGRVRISKDKADLAKALRAADNTTGPFQTYADVVTFVATLGANRRRRVPLGETSRKDPDPIPQEQFFTRGYESVINLLAIVDTDNPKVLGSDELYRII